MKMCACGEPLHYSSPEMEATIQKLVDELGECIDITIGDCVYEVPRHYIALHGVIAGDVPAVAEQYGFKIKRMTG